MQRDDGLRPYATERQWEILEAIWEHGGQRAAGRALGTDQGSISRMVQSVVLKAARAGYSPDHDMTRPAPPGYQLRGTSTLYRQGDPEPVLQWVKTTRDLERQAQMMHEIVEALREELPREELRYPTEEPTDYPDMLACYPVGDHHVGLYAWAEEADGDYDLAEADRLLRGAFDHLVAGMPPTRSALVAFLGDFMHYDGLDPVTPTAKNQLDSDGRYAKMVRTAVRLMRYSVRAAAEKHRQVRVVVAAGNHDLSSSVFLAELLAALYEGEDRVTVETSASLYHYHEHGRCLIGIHHGHRSKLPQLPLIMAQDVPEAWGRTKHRYIWTGHVHHDRVQDVQGTRVESFRVLPPADAYATAEGYRSGRSMQAILLHPDHGEVMRTTVRPEMLS